MDLDHPWQSHDDPELLPDAPELTTEPPRVLHRLLRQSRNEGRRYRPFNIEIDLELIQSWRRECRGFHGGCCNDRYSEALSQHASQLNFVEDRKSTRLNSSHMSISYAVFCLKKKKKQK